MDLPTHICHNTQRTQKDRNALVHEVLHKLNKIRKFFICCVSLIIIHKINYIDKLFTCSTVIVPRHWYAHSIKKLGVLVWPNT